MMIGVPWRIEKYFLIDGAMVCAFNRSAMRLMERVQPLAELAETCRAAKEQGRRIVLTNGCFDILHAGHVTYLEEARALGDALVVALNSDASVRSLKGPSRPINSEMDRACVVAALRCVDYVTIFESPRVTAVIEALRPTLYAKGGDYTPETLDAEERSALIEAGTAIHILPLVPGRSTTAILQRAK